MQRNTNTNRTIRRVVTFGLGVTLGLSFLTGTASASTGKHTSERGNQGQTSSTKDCDGTHHSNTGHGANTSGSYDNTCDGSPSRNGSDKDGTRGSRPCAGCVGNADDKNPPGQYPDGPTDHNNGYECDQKGRSENEGNNGVGFGNPAHTGCVPTSDEGGEEPGGDVPSGPTCPAGDAAMTDHALEVADGTGHAVFTIAAGCPDLQLALASYDSAGQLVDSDTGVFGAGDHELSVDVPACGYEVDFVRGTVLPQLGSGANPYATDDRLIEADKASMGSCGGAGHHQGSSSSSDSPSVRSSDSSSPVVDASVVAAATVVPAEAAPASVEVLGVQLGAAGPPSDDVLGRPTDVMGVQLERVPEAAGLARTGATLLPLAALGVALCLLGVALQSGRRDVAISIAERLNGF
jgi:hypothetical protein